eukprot:7475584-Heterocapsa_arctica.AAC.1
MGPSGAGYSTSPTPFTQVSAFNPIKWTMPGGGDATGVGPTQTCLGAPTGASYSTGQAPSSFRNPPGFSPSPERPGAPAAPWLPPSPCPQCLIIGKKLSDLGSKCYAS